MKRGRGESLTGGSGDVNPQTMILYTAQTTADITKVSSTALPIPRLPIRKGRSLVIELLDVEFIRTTAPVSALSETCVFLTTNPASNPLFLDILQDPRTIAQWVEWTVVATVAGFLYYDSAKKIDLTDEAGHGFLVATDQIFLGVNSSTTGIGNNYVARLRYRFKDVALEEYIGIVQGQQ